MLPVQHGSQTIEQYFDQQANYSSKIGARKTRLSSSGAVIVTALNQKETHIKELQKKFQQYHINYRMLSNKKKVRPSQSLFFENNFIIVDDSQGSITLGKQFQKLKMKKIDYPIKNDVKNVIDKFFQFMGLRKQFKKQIFINEKQNCQSYKNQKEKHINKSYSFQNVYFQKQKIFTNKKKYNQVKFEKEKTLFVLLSQNQSQKYFRYLHRHKNKNVKIIKSLQQYNKLCYKSNEGENCLLLSPALINKQLSKFRNLKDLYIFDINYQQLNKKLTVQGFLNKNLQQLEESQLLQNISQLQIQIQKQKNQENKNFKLQNNNQQSMLFIKQKYSCLQQKSQLQQSRDSLLVSIARILISKINETDKNVTNKNCQKLKQKTQNLYQQSDEENQYYFYTKTTNTRLNFQVDEN